MAYRSERRIGTGHNFFRRRGQSVQRQERANVLQGTDVTFNLGGDVTGSQEMIGGNIFIPSASITASGSAIITEHQTNSVDGWADIISILDVSGSVDYSSDIIGVKNGTTLVLRKPITVRVTDSAAVTSSLDISKLPVIPFRLTYNRAPHFESSQNYLSFAKIGLYDISTFTGDVSRVKSYMQSSGDPTAFEYKLVEDTQLETTELLIDSGSTTGLDRVGLFLTSSIIDNQWEVSKTNTPNVATLVQDNDFIVAGMAITSSYNTMTASDATLDAYYTVNPVQAISNIRPKTQYRISGDYHAIVDSGSQAQMDVYLSGSAFLTANYTGSLGVHLGRFVFPSTGPSEVDDESGMLFSMIPMPFEPDEIGDAQVVYVISDGKWTLADISMQAIQETGFSPGSTEIMIPIRAEVNDRLNFKFEFYDVNNNKANYEATSSEMLFQGPNLFIGGGSNILSGSMVIGNVIGSGIEMAGISSGFIRSIGYEGFISASAGDDQAGFMIWSGSALPSAPDNYSDVGLELNAGPNKGSFRFRTNPSVLDIRADAFFVGNPDLQFISGADSSIEISSSNFHLTPEGDVTMSGTITATAGNIGDWEISSGNIVGSNITMDANSSRIYKTDDNNELSGYYLDFTPGNNYYVRFGTDFAVSSSGTLIAKGAIIEGVLTSSEGFIGNWTIAPDTIHKFTDPTYTGISSTGDTRFFAGATSLATSGSAPFNVKSTGAVSATSGNIAGWTLATNKFSAGSGGTYLALIPGTGIQMGHETFGSAPFSVTNAGVLKATSGTIGGFTLSANELTATNFVLNPSNKYLSLGTANTVFIADADTGIQLGHATFGSAPFSVTTGGALKAESGVIGGWTIGATTLTGGNVTLNSAGSIKVGTLSGVTDVADTSTGFFADNSGNVLIKSGIANEGYIQANGGDITIKSKTFNLLADGMKLDSATDDGTIALGATFNNTVDGVNAGIYMNGGGDFLVRADASNYIKFKQSGSPKLEIKAQTFELDTTTLDISSANKNIRIFDTDGTTEYVRIGEISTDTSDKYGLKIYDGNGTTDDDIIAMFGSIGNRIAGWEITNTQIRSIPAAGFGEPYDFNAGEDGIIIQSNAQTASIESAGFVSGLKGFRMSTLGNGSAEFENMRIRGTLRTTVFEKESVNVVGGQLMVANSTTIQALKSGSVVLAGASSVTATDVTMSVANASGFSRGEILKVKGIDDTGFSVEYLYVTGSKRYSEDPTMAYLTASEDAENNAPPLDPDGIAGELYVGRGYGSIGPSQISSSISVLSAGIGLNESGGEPEFGTIDTISVDDTGSLAVQDILIIDEEKMKITAIAGTETEASASLTVVRDFHDTIPSIHNAGTTVYKFNPDMQFLAGLVSSARPYQEGQVLVSTGKYASGTGYHDKFSYNANVSDTPNADGEYRILSGSTHITTNVTGSTQLEIYKIDKDGTDHDSLFSLFDKSSYIVILIDGTDEWVRFRVSGNPTVDGNVHTYPISLNQDFYQVTHPIDPTDTTSNNVDFWFLSNIQDVSSGYIMMNANPNDPYSPYMDFVERTGSGVYDLQLRTRLGDLSGLSSAYLYGEEEPGFGLYTENGFFKGAIHAMTGSIHGILHVATQAGGIETGQRVSIGRNVSGTNDGIEVNNNNYWYTTAEFRVGDSNNYLHISGTEASPASVIDITTDTFNLEAGGLKVLGSGTNSYIKMGGIADATTTNTANSGFFADNAGNVLIKGNISNNNYLKITGSGSIDIKAQSFDLLAGTAGNGQVGVSTDRIALGSTLPTGDGGNVTDGTGFYVGKDGHMLLGNAAAGQPKIIWNGSSVTLVGTLRQTSAGVTITDYVDRGTWAVATAYAVNDLVQYASGGNTSTYKCLVAHTSADPAGSDATTGTPNVATTGWAVYVQGTTGVTGAAAKTTVVNANSLVFVKAQDGTLSPTTIAITANNQNTTADGAWTKSAGTLTDIVATHTGASCNVTSANFVDGMVVTYTLAAGDGSVVDAITLKQLDEGSGTVQAILSNSAHVLPASNSGVVSSHAGSGTTIRVYEGATELTFVTGTPVAGEWKVVVGDTANITEGGITDSGTYCTIGDHSAAADGTDQYVITYTISGKTANGTTFTSFTQDQSLSKSKAGLVGSNAQVIKLAPSKFVINYATDDTESDSISFVTTTQGMTGTLYYEFLVDGSAPTGGAVNSTTSTWAALPDADEPAIGGTATVKVNVRQDATDGTLLASDQVTIFAVQDGSDTINGFLTNASHTVQANLSGTPTTYTGAGGTFTVFVGGTDVTTACAFTVNSAASQVKNLLTLAIVAGTGVYSLSGTSWSTGTETFTLTAVIPAANAGTAADVTITSDYSISKSQTGSTGLTGASLNIIFQRAASTPTAPNDSAGVPSGWVDDPPTGTDILWASQGVKTAGGSNYSWGTPYQVEGTSVAEVSIYRLNSNTINNTDGSYNFTTSALTAPSGWSSSVPGLASDGDDVYVSVGLFSGAPTETAATTTWATPAVYATRTDGTTPSNGVDARAIILTPNQYTVVYGTNDAIIGSDIDFTTAVQGLVGAATYKFEVDGSQTQAAAALSTYDMADNLRPAIGGEILVKVTLYDAGVEKANDTVTIYAIQDGSSTVNGFLTNTAHTVQADSSGTVGSFTGAGGIYKIYVGATDVTDSCTFAVSSETGVDVSIVAGTDPVGGVYTISSMSAVQGTAVFQATIPAATAGTASNVVLTADYSISKSVAGTTAKTIVLSAESNVFIEDNAGDLAPTSIKFHVNKQNTSAIVSWDVTSDNPAVTLYTTAGGTTAVTTQVDAYLQSSAFSTNTDVIVKATCDSITDTATVVRLVEGSGNVAAVLSNETHVFQATFAGAVSVYTNSGTDIKVYEGATLLDYDNTGTADGTWKVTVTAINDITEGSPGEQGTTPDRYAAIIDHDGITTTVDEFVIEYTIDGTTFNGTTFQFIKTQSLSKSKAGEAITGATGAGTNFVFLRATVEPATPTADLLAIPTNWYDDPPTTPEETLWSSKGTVGVGGSTYAWGTVFQVEGTAVAEITIYKKASTVNIPTGGSYNFTSSTLSITGLTAGWVASIPALTTDGDKVYASSGLFSGSPEATAATATWAAPVLYAQRTDGTNSTVAGPAGAGVAYRGVWLTGTAYIGAETGTEANRKDIVKEPGGNGYWICRVSHTAGAAGTDAPPSSGELSNDEWETFGASFTSVATDILFAQDVYADYTVNIGTNAGNPVISLVSDGGDEPYISMGQRAAPVGGGAVYGADGIWLGYVNGSTATDATCVTTDTDATVTHTANTNIVVGKYVTGAGIPIGAYIISIVGVVATSTSFELSVNATATSDPTVTLTFFTKIPQMSLKGGSDSLTWNGADLSMTGTVTAAAGSIANWSIVPNNIYNLGSGIPTDTPSTGIVLSTNLGITDNDPVINVYDGTTINAALGNYANDKYGIFASEGEIGGWTIDSDAIYIGTEVVDDTFTDALGSITLGAGFIGANQFKIAADGSATFKGAITGGSIDISSAWHVNSTGDMWWGNVLYAASTISISSAGIVNFTGGTIAGWTFASGTSALYNAKTTYAVDDGNDGVWIGPYGIAFQDSDVNKFTVLASTGAMHAELGDIGGWTIGSALYNIKTTYDAVDNEDGVYIGTDGLAFQDSDINKFTVLGSTGAMHAELGDIAGWNFDTEKLKKEHVTAAYKMEFDTNATIVQTGIDVSLINAYWDDDSTTINFASTTVTAGLFVYGHSTIPKGTTVTATVTDSTSCTISNSTLGAASGVEIVATANQDITGVQALTMISGSDANWDSSTAEAPLVQISNVEAFIDEDKSYILGRDKISTESNFEEEDFEHTSDLFAGGFTG